MTTVGMIVDKLNRFAPPAAACDWDNPGLLLGYHDTEVTKIYVALDATERVAEEAANAGCELIVTHHPLIFHGIKCINDDSAEGIKLMDLISNGISVYSMHTNFDSCPGGMGDLVCEKLNMRYLGRMEPSGYQPKERENGFAGDKGGDSDGTALLMKDTTGAEDLLLDPKFSGRDYGVGFIGELPQLMTAEEFAAFVKETFGLPYVQYYDAGHPIKRVVCCPGSGRGEQGLVTKLHADAFLSGDMGHHEGLDLNAEGISLIDAGHYGLEHVFVEAMGERLAKYFPELTIIRDTVSFPAAVV